MCTPCCIISELGKNKQSLFFFKKQQPFSSLVLCITSCSFSLQHITSQTFETELCSPCELFWIYISSLWGLVRGCVWERLKTYVNFMSCGQAFTVSDSPWKLCLWWFQTTDSPSFLVPFSPWHRRSICWADNTQQRHVYTINNKIYLFTWQHRKCWLSYVEFSSKYVGVFFFKSSVALKSLNNRQN